MHFSAASQNLISSITISTMQSLGEEKQQVSINLSFRIV